MIDKNYNGIVEDPRTEEEKVLDYKYEDLAKGDIPLNWIEYNEKNLKSYPIQNQDGSLSCVAQGTSKILAMHEVKEGRGYKQLCPKLIYDWRQNYPDGGMWLPNALAIACNTGTCEEHLLPCDMKGETFMNDKSLITNTMLEDAQNYRGKYYFEITGGIDKIAEVMEQGYGVLLGFRFDYNEWTDVPVVHADSQKTVGHGVAAVDYCLYEGKKALIIEDSWGPTYGKGGRRIITEEFLTARCFYAGYITSLPNYIFTKTLRLGSKGLDVKMLQQKLNDVMGYILKVDGQFGKMTLQAVTNFQHSKGLVSDGIVGPKTNKVLNEI
jgi:hypothetical protein